MPGNDTYEPFMLDEDQFSILGIAIEIIKKEESISMKIPVNIVILIAILKWNFLVSYKDKYYIRYKSLTSEL